MRTLLFHCKKYKVEIDKLANRPIDITPEEVKEKKQVIKNCIVCLITVEKEDNIKSISEELSKEIIKMSKEIGRKNIVILPFAHLSNNLSNSELGIKFFNLLEDKLQKYNLIRAHYGSHKSLLLDIAGHPGNARYREF